MINKQKRFVRSTADDRVGMLCMTSHDTSHDTQIQHYLEEATSEYMAQFRKMQKQHRPELTFRNEERLLHYLPSGAFGGAGDG